MHRNKDRLQEEGSSMPKLEEELYMQEVDIIRGLYDDYEGRADSIETHINKLE